MQSCRTLTCPTCDIDDGEEVKVADPGSMLHVEFKGPQVINNDGKKEENVNSFDAIDLEIKSVGDRCGLFGIIITPELLRKVKIYRKWLDNEEKGEENFELPFDIDDILPEDRLIILLDEEYSGEPYFSNILKRITTPADGHNPPRDTILSCDDDCISCYRDRNCIKEATGFIDKIELRAMGAYRLNTKESIVYEGLDGGTEYYKETFGTERGGTDIVMGIETAFLFNIPYFSNKDNTFDLGLMTGYWPVDGGNFLPLSAHLRYTFDNRPDYIDCDCNAWYLFGDLGLALDLEGERPLVLEKPDGSTIWSSFWDIGIGYDWWLGECSDFSVDIGFRHTSLPLPENLDCVECTGETGKFPVRKINQVFLRAGITW